MSHNTIQSVTNVGAADSNSGSNHISHHSCVGECLSLRDVPRTNIDPDTGSDSMSTDEMESDYRGQHNRNTTTTSQTVRTLSDDSYPLSYDHNLNSEDDFNNALLHTGPSLQYQISHDQISNNQDNSSNVLVITRPPRGRARTASSTQYSGSTKIPCLACGRYFSAKRTALPTSTSASIRTSVNSHLVFLSQRPIIHRIPILRLDRQRRNLFIPRLHPRSPRLRITSTLRNYPRTVLYIYNLRLVKQQHNLLVLLPHPCDPHLRNYLAIVLYIH